MNIVPDVLIADAIVLTSITFFPLVGVLVSCF